MKCGIILGHLDVEHVEQIYPWSANEQFLCSNRGYLYHVEHFPDYSIEAEISGHKRVLGWWGVVKSIPYEKQLKEQLKEFHLDIYGDYQFSQTWRTIVLKIRVYSV